MGDLLLLLKALLSICLLLSGEIYSVGVEAVESTHLPAAREDAIDPLSACRLASAEPIRTPLKLGGPVLKRIERPCPILGNITIESDLAFSDVGELRPAEGVTIDLEGAVHAAANRRIFAGSGRVIVARAPSVSVAWWGAGLPDTDAAPAFRMAMMSNRTIYVPPGTYAFKSTEKAPCCAFDPPGLLIRHLSNFKLIGDRAVITSTRDSAFSSVIHFDQDDHFVVSGITILGTRDGLTKDQENVGITLSNDSHFSIDHVKFGGNLGGNGAAVAGDWLIDGIFLKIDMSDVGQCFDVAFLKDVTFQGIHALGAGANGGGVGTKCLSIINDGPNAHENKTGVVFQDTEHVTVRRFIERNFATGAYITSGSHYLFDHDCWLSNPGMGSAEGIGMLITKVENGAFKTGDHPPSDFVITHNHFIDNGASVPGAGLMLYELGEARPRARISIDHSIFARNRLVDIATVPVSDADHSILQYRPDPRTVNEGACG